MSIRVNLPDGSVANFPDGMDPQAMQDEIERYLAQSQQQAPQDQRRVMTPGQEIARDVNRLRDTVGRGDGEFQENFDWQQGEAAPQARQGRPAGDTRQRRQGRPDGRPEQNDGQFIQDTVGPSDLNTPAMQNAMRGQDRVDPERSGPQQRNGKRPDQQMPMNAMEQMYQDNAQRRGPDRRNADVQIRDNDRESLIQRALRAARTTSAAIVGGTSQEPNPDHQFFQSGGLAGDIGEVARRTPAIIGGVARSAADLANTVVNPYVKYATGYEFPTSRSQREQSPPAGAAQAAPPAAGPEAVQQPAAGQPAGELPSVQNPNAGQRTNLSMPRGLSVQDAREQGMPNTAPYSLGDGRSIRPGPVPKTAMTNAVKSGMENLMANADRIILERVRLGDIKGATAFREFIRSEQAQKGMEYMNRTFAAIQYQDNSTFAASTAKMVESYDPDGDWEVDTKQTRLTQDTDGNPSGAILALRNKNTGEVSEQTYQGLQQVYEGLSRYGDPQGQFVSAQERIAQAQQQQIANAKSYQEAYDEAAKLMFKNGFTDALGITIPPEEMQQRDQMIRDYIASSRPDLPQPPPRQPAAAPPPAASGIGANIRSFFGGSTGDKPVPTFDG